jgi:lipoyl(octanoyl) transferase
MRLWPRSTSLYQSSFYLRNKAAVVAAAVVLPSRLRRRRPNNNSTLLLQRPCRGTAVVLSFGQAVSSLQRRCCYTSVAVVHSGLLPIIDSSGAESIEKMDYIRGWAWQTVLLHQRLLAKRRQQQRHHSAAALPHVLLVLEHEPVYTLGRGATVDHLTCFASTTTTTPSSSSNHHHHHHDDANYGTASSSAAARLRLDRSYRQVDAARLSMDDSAIILEPFLNASLSGAHALLSRNRILQLRSIPDTATAADLCPTMAEPIWNAVDAVCRSVHQRHATFPPVCTPRVMNNNSSSGVVGVAHAVGASVGGGVPVYRMERGGEVTFHGPGQLLIYPIFDLAQEPFRTCDLHWYLRSLEQVVIDAVTELVESSSSPSPRHCTMTATEPAPPRPDVAVHRIDRDADYTGVWINGTDKIAAIGVAASRWITTHGIALNVSTNLSYFDQNMIVPCGIPGGNHQNNDSHAPSADSLSKRGVTSLAALGVHTNMSQTAEIVLKHLSRVFAIDLIQGEPIH